MALILTQFNFLTFTISRNDQQFYNSERTALGLFGITNPMIKEFGTEEIYYEDLASEEAPFKDFRFDKNKSLTFILNASEDLNIIDADLIPFARGLAPYVGLNETQLALDNVIQLIDEEDNLTTKISLLCSNLTQNVSEYIYFLINTCKHNYFVRR